MEYKKLDKINIFILSYDRFELTKRCVDSIQKNVVLEKKIFICDNNSSEITKENLKKLESSYQNVKIYWNNENKWVCGFNTAINENLDDFFVITDNDIELINYNGQDVINHMFYLLQKYILDSIGLNFYKSNTIAHEVAGGDSEIPEVFTNTNFLDSTFQLMRKDIFIDFEESKIVRFEKQHMGYRRRCFKTKGLYSGVGFTADPWFCTHMGNYDIELDAVKNGNQEMIDYWNDKIRFLSVESPTQYDQIKKVLEEHNLLRS